MTVTRPADALLADTRLEVALRGLFPAGVAVAVATPRLDEELLLAPEHVLVRHAVAKRRAEFSTVRWCARLALRELGWPAAPILKGSAGEPVWPEGIVGSMTHTRGLCAAVLGRATDVGALGLDVEQDTPLSGSLEPVVCVEDERTWARSYGAGATPFLAKLVFSAKEAFYKCQYPLSGRLLDFLGVALSINLHEHTFRVAAVDDATVPPDAWKPVRGRFAHIGGYVMTGAIHPGPMRRPNERWEGSPDRRCET